MVADTVDEGTQSTDEDQWHDAVNREQMIDCIQAEIVNGTGGKHVAAQLEELSATSGN
jgi:hypothetical protein